MHLRISNGDLNLNTRLNGDGSDLLHHIWGAEEIDHTLVYTELKSVPCVGSYKYITQRSYVFTFLLYYLSFAVTYETTKTQQNLMTI